MALSVMYLCVASRAGAYPRAGPNLERRPEMAQKQETPVIPERATQAVTRPTSLPLNEFVLKPEQFCHRDQAELTDIERLRPLMDSLTVEGLETPVEFVRDSTGKPV